MSKIELYDATLRDGMGGAGMSLTAQEKVRVVGRLDELGVDLIEAGFPASNPKELELFGILAEQRLRHATIVAFGMTRRRGVRADADNGLAILADSFAPACTLVGKSSTLHVEKVVRASRSENLAMIADSVAFLVGRGKRVLFDAEHFFDGFVLDSAYALQTLAAAIDAGAERVVLCDTNGGSLPGHIGRTVEAVRQALPHAPLGIHTHNDSGCAVANTLVAVEAGATHVQGTVNGIGERTGNANLITIIADLQLKMGHRVLSAKRLARLTDTARFVDEMLNRAPDPAQPYVGRHAFAHKAGMHASGVRAHPATFEHISPQVVGNDTDLLISELSGRAAVAEKAAAAGIAFPAGADGERLIKRVLASVKELEHQGFQFEGADASFELLLRKQAGQYEPLFRLESWRVLVEQNAEGHVDTEATIKLWHDDRRYVRTAEGNGPVNALDRALREAIAEFYPQLAAIELVDYKVRLLETSHGTGAVTRVHIDSEDGHATWGTTGVGENVVAASWQALVDALEYPLQPRNGKSPRRAKRGSDGTRKARTAR
jgi:2-isopropylmalate synthase